MYYISVHRENKTLSDEIKDLMEQISEGGRSIHEIEKQRKRLETEKFELETCLGDAESALEQEENKLLRLSLEVNQVRADIEKRIQEKEEEFEGNNLTINIHRLYNILAESKATFGTLLRQFGGYYEVIFVALLGHFCIFI